MALAVIKLNTEGTAVTPPTTSDTSASKKHKMREYLAEDWCH
jgi:hypothetical protein